MHKDSPQFRKFIINFSSCHPAMKIFNLFYLLLLLLAVVAPSSSARPDFLNLRRKYHRHYCPHRRCLPLHSRVPFP